MRWLPWSEESLAKAKAEDKPLLISIGYAACHWCHVMAHETFEDEAAAAVMNEHFICIKVDREERPDIDQIYMEAVQMMTGGGAGRSTVSPCRTAARFTAAPIIRAAAGLPMRKCLARIPRQPP